MIYCTNFWLNSFFLVLCFAPHKTIHYAQCFFYRLTAHTHGWVHGTHPVHSSHLLCIGAHIHTNLRIFILYLFKKWKRKEIARVHTRKSNIFLQILNFVARAINFLDMTRVWYAENLKVKTSPIICIYIFQTSGVFQSILNILYTPKKCLCIWNTFVIFGKLLKD